MGNRGLWGLNACLRNQRSRQQRSHNLYGSLANHGQQPTCIRAPQSADSWDSFFNDLQKGLRQVFVATALSKLGGGFWRRWRGVWHVWAIFVMQWAGWRWSGGRPIRRPPPEGARRATGGAPEASSLSLLTDTSMCDFSLIFTTIRCPRKP